MSSARMTLAVTWDQQTIFRNAFLSENHGKDVLRMDLDLVEVAL